MRTRTSAALMLALTFLLGTVTGAVSVYIYRGHQTVSATGTRPPGPRDIVEGMSKTLGLDADQKQSLGRIIEQSRERYRALSKQFRPQYDAIRDQSNQEIRAILRNDQKEKFEAMIKEMEANRHRSRPPRLPR